MNRLQISILLVALAITISVASAQEEGLFADFVTNRGNFTARLEMEKAPKTVANFAGLASGVQPWVDLPSGQVKTEPFYNGNTFHRVVAGFVIQAGSKNGEGTDGPGYTFEDEIHPDLIHDRPYILSMANSGLHSNGSQFFITTSVTSHLDGKHAVFGEIISGTEVVDQINAIPVEAGGKPTEPQVIESISIRRVGEAAESFDLLGQGLPFAQLARPSAVYHSPSDVSIHYTQSPNRGSAIYRTENLQEWTGEDFLYQTSEEPLGVLKITDEIAETPQRFYRFVDVAYPEPLYTPSTIDNRKITLNITSETANPQSWTLVLDMGENGEGQFSWDGADFQPIESYLWVPEAYRGILPMNFPPETIVPIRLNLHFDSETAGVCRGTVFNTFPFDVTGDFTTEPKEVTDPPQP